MVSHPGNLSVDMHVCRRHTSYSRLLILPLLFLESSVVVRLRVGVLLVVTVFTAVTFPVVEASAADPLHVQVDRLVTESPLGLVSGTSTDGEFLRRLYLAVLGRIPSVEETRTFLADKSPTKRAAAVDSLLGTPAYVRRMTNVLDVMLSERRGDGEVKRGEWQAFLKQSIESNKPWNILAAEILGADAVDAKQRGRAKFLMDRGVEVNQMTREVGRMFFGVDLQCAQCHNHPLIDDYLQKDYYGIYAFLNRTYLFKPDKKKPGVLAEKPTGGVAFSSVFTGDSGVSRPRLLGERQLDEPTIAAGQEYKVKPDKKKKNLRPIPAYSRREQLARLVRDGNNRYFARNMANRLWALAMGRGLVEPLDLHHSDNPPSHPELLALLTDHFVATKYDIRSFFRELVLTQTFARGSGLPADLVARSAKATQLLAGVTKSEVKLVAELAAADKRVEAAVAAETKADEPVAALAKTLKPANDKVAAEKKKHDPLAKALAAATKKLQDKQKPGLPLVESARQAVAAAKLLAGDKELAGIVAKLDGRAKKVAAEMAALEKDRAAKQAAAEVTGKALKAAEVVRDAAVKKHAEAVKLAEKRAWETDQVRTARRVINTRLTSTRRRKGTLAVLAGFAAKQKVADTARADLVSAEKSLSPVSVEFAKVETVLAKAKQELANAETDRKKTATVLASTQKKVTTLPAVAKTLATAAGQASTALKTLGEDKELAGITKTLEERSARLNSDLAAARKVLPGQQSAATVAAKRAATARTAVDKVAAEHARLSKQRAPLLAAVGSARVKFEAADGALRETLRKLSKAWSEQFAIGTVGPLSPEQLGWSLLEATGQVGRQQQSVVAELNKKSPLKPADKKDMAKLAARKLQVEQATYDKLKGAVGSIITLYGAGSGQPQNDFFATIDQALFMANGGPLKGWLAPGGGNLTERLGKMTDTKKLAEELYLSVLTRLPTDEEVADVGGYLKGRSKDKRSAAIQEIAWALLTSAEFRFNH
ncbi:MAG TPA: hypothetical protein DCE43_14055 [Planctomycetaceae bacterium]|nr:hypothetical protein [Planctomycetaceae bacterium]